MFWQTANKHGEITVQFAANGKHMQAYRRPKLLCCPMPRRTCRRSFAFLFFVRIWARQVGGNGHQGGNSVTEGPDLHGWLVLRSSSVIAIPNTPVSKTARCPRRFVCFLAAPVANQVHVVKAEEIAAKVKPASQAAWR